MALAAECFVPQLGCEALFPVSGARVPHHHNNTINSSPHLPSTTPVPSASLGKEYAVPKDYSIPLHVDCSVEYDLPDCAKPPQGVKIEPLLMIHPSHFRRLDSLRRCPFVNNLPSVTSNNTSSKSGTNYGLPPSAPAIIPSSTPACQYPQVSRATRASRNQSTKIKESPNILINNNTINNVSEHPKRWPTQVVKNQCCNTKGPGPVQYGHGPPSHSISNNVQPNHIQYRVADVPDPYWSACGGPALPFAPKEGDTLENSTFGKYPKYGSCRLRSHPYSAVDPNCITPMIAANCDTTLNNKTLDILQGNLVTNNKNSSNNSNSRLISPFHAKMFSGVDTNIYQNYPSLVMYK